MNRSNNSSRNKTKNFPIKKEPTLFSCLRSEEWVMFKTKRLIRNYCLCEEPIVVNTLPYNTLLLEIFPVLLSTKTQDYFLAQERMKNVLKTYLGANAAVNMTFDKDSGRFIAGVALVAERSDRGNVLKKREIYEKTLIINRKINLIFSKGLRLRILLTGQLLFFLLSLFVTYVCDLDSSVFYLFVLGILLSTPVAIFYWGINKNRVPFFKEKVELFYGE